MAELWSPEHKVVLERRLWIAVLRAQRDLGVDVPDGVDRGLRAGRRPGRPRLDRRARARHPPRREGPHRGVLRARRPRAHPQGHDVARPHRERRAAPGPRGARARPRPRGRGARPAWPTRAAEHADARDGRPQPQRPRPGDDARQAVRQRGRGAAARLRTARRPASPAIRCAASRARSARSRTSSTCSAATRRSSTSSSGASPSTSASRASLGCGRPGVPPVARPRRRRPRSSSRRRARPAWPRRIRLMAGHELVTEGFARRPGRLVGHAAQDEHPLVRADQRPHGGARAAT